MDFIGYFLNEGLCYICKKDGYILCERCFSKLDSVENPIYIDGVRYYSLYIYNHMASKILITSKYPPYHFYVLKFLLGKSKIPNFDNYLLCPIPLNSLKFYERGFNQVEIITKFLSKRFKLHEIGLLNRVRYTQPLYKLSSRQRKYEMKEVFRPTIAAKLIPQKHSYQVLLVDDLITTGNTVKNCIQALTKLGFNQIEVFSIFRA